MKLFSFIKICINFSYLEEVLKILKYLTLKNFSSPNIISYTILIINYLSIYIYLTIVKIFYLVLEILINFSF